MPYLIIWTFLFASFFTQSYFTRVRSKWPLHNPLWQLPCSSFPHHQFHKALYIKHSLTCFSSWRILIIAMASLQINAHQEHDFLGKFRLYGKSPWFLPLSWQSQPHTGLIRNIYMVPHLKLSINRQVLCSIIQIKCFLMVRVKTESCLTILESRGEVPHWLVKCCSKMKHL